MIARDKLLYRSISRKQQIFYFNSDTDTDENSDASSDQTNQDASDTQHGSHGQHNTATHSNSDVIFNLQNANSDYSSTSNEEKNF